MSDANRQTGGSSNPPLGDKPATDVASDEPAALAADTIRSTEAYEKRVVCDGRLAGTSFAMVEFDECRFASTDLSATKWQTPRLCDAQVERCDLANARWTNANWEHVELHKCRGTGLQLLDANCCDTLMIGCKFNLAAFHGSKFRDCRFEKCDLREADFEGVEFYDTVFRNCDLRAARFPNCKLKNVDLRGSHLAGVQIDPTTLRGAKVDLAQLPDLAELFGVIIETLEDT